MAGIPQNFQAISNVLPTYNFTDIVAGTGYVLLYAGKTVDLTLLSNYTYYSNSILTSGSFTGDGAMHLSFSVDFDLLLNRPLNIAGTGIVNIPFNADTNASGYVVATLRKWDGATETDIVSNTSSTVAAYNMTSTDLIIPLTHFKIGETLRLTVDVYGASVLAGKLVKIAHDPMNRTTGWDTTGAVPSKLTLQLPVRLNL
jgi:hypothetical protein